MLVTDKGILVWSTRLRYRADRLQLQPTHLGRFGVATPGLAWRKNLGNFALIEVV
jgi:hypothetical protein